MSAMSALSAREIALMAGRIALRSFQDTNVLGLWIEQTEGAKFWLKVVNELKARGVNDILIAVVDGLKGFPEAITSVFPQTIVQTCIVHLIRNSARRAWVHSVWADTACGRLAGAAIESSGFNSAVELPRGAESPGLGGLTDYSSTRCPWISRAVMPRAYRLKILSSKPSNRVCPLAISCGSKLPARSRGIDISTSPSSVSTVFELVPLRLLPLPRPAGS